VRHCPGGLRFARCANDCNIYVRSRRTGERVMESLTRFKLMFKVNEQKSTVVWPWERKFLGRGAPVQREGPGTERRSGV